MDFGLHAIRMNHNRNVVCMFARGPKVTHYLGIDGCQLTALQMPNNDFEKEFPLPLENKTPVDFAKAYVGEPESRFVPLSGAATRVLLAILRGQAVNEDDLESANHLESTMSKNGETGFRKPDGPVAQVHAFLDKKVDAIKAGTISRKELVDQLVEKGISQGTASTQCGVWARNNGVQFVRPTQAAEAKKEQAASKRAAKKKAA